MWSLALFPCSYTNGAAMIGELLTTLRLPVYSDSMLFSEVCEQFGIPVADLQKIIYQPLPSQRRYRIKREKYINCMRCSLMAQKMKVEWGCLYYGLLTSLLDYVKCRVFKVLIFDDIKNRVQRAMRQEGFSEKSAWMHIKKSDRTVYDWTRFLFQKPAYDSSLYDLVIPLKRRSLLDLSLEITDCFREIVHADDFLLPQTPEMFPY